jgi:cytochrome c biogenesis protein CcdA
MLPAYLSYFLGMDRVDDDAGASVMRAVVVSSAVSAGFLAVFGLAGVLISHFSVSVDRFSPWLTIAIGVVLLILGSAFLLGWEATVALPKLERGTRGRGLRSMFVFGISYAIASLSCTLPVFGSAVSSTFTRSNFASGLAVFVVYAAGMALVLTVLTVALALARHSLVHWLRQAMRFVNRVAGALLLIAGAYLAWYGIYELRVRGDSTTTTGPVDVVNDISFDLSRWVSDVGAARVGLILVIVVAGALLFALSRGPARPK